MWVSSYIYIYMYIYIHIHIYTYTHTHIYTYIHTHIHTYIHTHIDTHTHRHTYRHTYTYIYLNFSFFKRLYLFIFRERGREWEREGEKHWSAASPTPPPGDLAHNPGMCLDQDLNQQPFGSQASAQSTEPHQPGLHHIYLNDEANGLKYSFLPWNCHNSGYFAWVPQNSLGGEYRLWTRWPLRPFLDLKLWAPWKRRVPILKSLEIQVVISWAFPKKHWLCQSQGPKAMWPLYWSGLFRC